MDALIQRTHGLPRGACSVVKPQLKKEARTPWGHSTSIPRTVRPRATAVSLPTNVHTDLDKTRTTLLSQSRRSHSRGTNQMYTRMSGIGYLVRENRNRAGRVAAPCLRSPTRPKAHRAVDAPTAVSYRPTLNESWGKTNLKNNAARAKLKAAEGGTQGGRRETL